MSQTDREICSDYAHRYIVLDNAGAYPSIYRRWHFAGGILLERRISKCQDVVANRGETELFEFIMKNALVRML